MSEQLTVEACLAWRELGGPQDGFSQHVWLVELEEWSEYRFDGDVPFRIYATADPVPSCGWRQWCAAPDALTAFTWLEEEHGWEWDSALAYNEDGEPLYRRWSARRLLANGWQQVDALSPSLLIIHIAAAHARQQQTGGQPA